MLWHIDNQAVKSVFQDHMVYGWRRDLTPGVSECLLFLCILYFTLYFTCDSFSDHCAYFFHRFYFSSKTFTFIQYLRLPASVVRGGFLVSAYWLSGRASAGWPGLEPGSALFWGSGREMNQDHYEHLGKIKRNVFHGFIEASMLEWARALKMT